MKDSWRSTTPNCIRYSIPSKSNLWFTPLPGSSRSSAIPYRFATLRESSSAFYLRVYKKWTRRKDIVPGGSSDSEGKEEGNQENEHSGTGNVIIKKQWLI